MRYKVIFEPYTERHYIKSLQKKYPKAWDKTVKALAIEFSRVDLLSNSQIAEVICVSPNNDIRIYKTEFKILGTNVSRHTSGYRCIIATHTNTLVVKVLLVYGKGDVNGKNETAWWQNVIKDNYSDYRTML